MLRFVADFLARHLQLREPPPALDAVVGAGERRRARGSPARAGSTADPSRDAPTPTGVMPTRTRRLVVEAANEPVADDAERGHADERLDELGPACVRREPREARRGVEAVPVRAAAPSARRPSRSARRWRATETRAGDERRRTRRASRAGPASAQISVASAAGVDRCRAASRRASTARPSRSLDGRDHPYAEPAERERHAGERQRAARSRLRATWPRSRASL